MVILSRRRTVELGVFSAAGIVVAKGLYPGPEHGLAHTAGTTYESTLVPHGVSRYKLLGFGPPHRLLVRGELAEPNRGRTSRRQPKAVVTQMTDLHLVDVQSPMRFEYLDRRCGTGHRPQELLATHGAAALVRRINGLGVGPATGRRIDAVVTTGDNTDNQSGTELEWLLTVLAGGTVVPDSGGADFEGVADSGLAEYWQPESAGTDRYKGAGFPAIPGLVSAATKPFVSPGLDVPWLVTMGNHDNTALGTFENLPYVAEWSARDRKIFSSGCDEALLLASAGARVTAHDGPDLGPDGVAGLLEAIGRNGEVRSVTPDERRMPFTGDEYVAELRAPRFEGAGPVGHGYGPGADGSRLYFTHWLADDVLAVSLDTTNQAGGADGSVGAEQLRWLEQTLILHDDVYAVVFSHHPSYQMSNVAPDPRNPTEQRYGGAELVDLLHRHPGVVAWVNGHCHRNRISPRRHRDPRRSFWEINTASHVDAPQQARVVELVHNGDRTLSLFTTMIDADSPARPSYDDLTTENLAGLYRELAFNDPRFFDRQGRARDRNTELLLRDPFS